MVRLHAQICPTGPNSKLTDVNEKEIDGIWRFVAEAKKQGIYVTISPYWAHSAEGDSTGGSRATTAPATLWGLLFFDETLQRGYKAWATALYARPNPYTKIPLAKDPAVAIIQVQNEDSLLFWTTEAHEARPAGQARPEVRRLARREIRLARSRREGLGRRRRPGDDFANGRVGLVDVYPMTHPATGQAGRRVADQVAFYRRHPAPSSTTRSASSIATNSAASQLINASNWRTANQTLMDDTERWTYSATRRDRRRTATTTAGSTSGPTIGWRIDPGDKFTQRSALLNPRELPTNLKQVVGHPMIITESSWVSPLAFQSEGPFLAVGLPVADRRGRPLLVHARRGRLQRLAVLPLRAGRRASSRFSSGRPRSRRSSAGSRPPRSCSARGTSSRASRSSTRSGPSRRSGTAKTPLIAEDPSFDPNRDKAPPVAPEAGREGHRRRPPRLPRRPGRGQVRRRPLQDPGGRPVAASSTTTRSSSGASPARSSLDYDIGLCTVDAPKAQGACGFLARAGTITLEGPLDPVGQRLCHDPRRAARRPAARHLEAHPDPDRHRRQAHRLGHQGRPSSRATTARPTRGLEVVSTGKPPWRIADSEFGLSIKNPDLTKATLLDPAGRPDGDVPVTKAKNGITLVPPTDTMYLILE